jgi:hypothetical protein
VERLEGRDLPSLYTEVVFQDAPVAYWRLGEAAGPTALDASGHGADGTYFNGVLLGQPGALAEDADTAASFDGLNDHVQFANPVADDFTIEAWIKTTAKGLIGTQAFQGNGLVWSDVSGVANDWVLAVLNDRASFHAGNPGGSITGTTPVNDGNFHHVAVTRVRGGAMRLYVDGQLEATGLTGDVPLNANPFVVVGGNTLDSRYFNGTMDEVAVYDRALSAGRVLAHFRAGHDHSPVANADAATTGEAAPVAVPVLANDHDPDGDPLTITGVTPPAHGAAVVKDNGTPADPDDDFIDYAPAADFAGTDQFTYTVSDGRGGTATAAVTVTVVNAAPQVDAGGDATLDEGGTFTAAGLFTDPGAGPWTAVVDYGDGSGAQPLPLNPDNTFSLSRVYPDGGLFTVTVAVTDNHGGTGSDAVRVTVLGAAPTAVFSGPGTVPEGGAAAVSFTDLSAPAGLRFAYDFDNDETFDVGDGTYAGSVDAASAAVPPGLLDDGSVIRTVRGRVLDQNGGFTDYTTTITVINVAPAAAFVGPGTVPEGEGATVSFAAAFDPSGADAAAGFRFAYDLDNDGAFDVGDGTYAGSGSSVSAAVPPAFLDDGPGTRTVRGRVLDKDGGFTDYIVTITVTNVAPTAGILGPAGGVRGQTRAFTLTAGDPSAADRAAGFTYLVDWGDGTPAQVIDRTPGNGTGTTADHVFAQTGTYTVRVTATDKDGGSSATTHTVTVTAVALQPNPFDPTKWDLVAGGTAGNDEIRVQQSDDCDPVTVSVNGVPQGAYEPTGRIVIFGHAGDDELKVSGDVSLSAWLYGGDGHDRLTGGDGRDVLLGGDGHDRLTGGDGRDLLIGGRGADRLFGNDSGDLLISGFTAFDADEVALAAVSAEWTSGHSFDTRVANLSGTGCDPADRLNGNYFLLDSGEGQTVFHDGETDILVGGSGSDWFFAGPLDWVTDRNDSDLVSVP